MSSTQTANGFRYRYPRGLEQAKRHRLEAKKWAQANPEKIRASNKRFYHRNKDRLKAKFRRYYKENKEKWFAFDIWKRYHLTVEDYTALLDAQGGVCAICGGPGAELTGRLSVDHCHKTGKVRGLLCLLCNSGVGKLHDDAKLLRKAAEYLERGTSGKKTELLLAKSGKSSSES